MAINVWAVLVCAVLSMVIGSIWFGPLFGKFWMRINGFTAMDDARKKELMKEMIPTYIIQLVLSLVQAVILAYFINQMPQTSGVVIGLLVWLGFALPSVAGLALWNGKSIKDRITLTVVSSGFHLVSLVVFSLILAAW